MNAILLAGDRSSCKLLCGQNKAFLSMEGWPLFVHVVAALSKASRVDTISIIGPRKSLMDVLEKALPVFLFEKKIEVLEQKESLLENICHAYNNTHRHAGKGDSLEEKAYPPALFLPSDIPLVTSQEIDTFIASSEKDDADYAFGVTAAPYLERFYPTPHRPGIKMPYLYVKDQAYRISNLHIARLRSLVAAPLFQRIYHCRYQKSLWNRLRMIGALLSHAGHTRILSFYMYAQAASFLAQRGFHRLADAFRRSLVLGEIEQEFSRLLNMRFKVVEINGGGAALDIDDERTYQIMASMFLKWHDALAMPVQTCGNGHSEATATKGRCRT